MERVKIPDYIDSPPELLFWEADELAPVMVLFAIGIITKTLSWMLIPMWLAGRFSKRFKENHLPGFIWHLLFRYGMVSLGKRLPNGFIRDYVE